MYVRLDSGSVAVIGRWPSEDEVAEVEGFLKEARTSNDRILILDNEDIPLTRDYLEGFLKEAASLFKKEDKES